MSSAGNSNVRTYIVPQSRPTISAIQNVSPIQIGQSMKPEVAEKLGLESWENYNRRMETQRAAVIAYSDTIGNVHVVEDYSKQGGGEYDTIISGPATQPGGGWSGSGFNWRREQLLKQQAVGKALKRSGLEERLIREGKLSGYEVNGKYFREESEAKNYIENLKRLERQHASMGRDPFADMEFITKEEWKAQRQEQGIVVPRFGKMISREEFSAKYPTPFMKAGTAFEKYETQIARRLNLQEKAIEPLEEWYSTGKKSLARMGLVSEPKVEKVTEEFVSGAAYGAANKPLTTAGNVALALLVTKGAGALVSRIPAVAVGLGAGKVARNINAINVLGAGLAAAYGFDVAGRVMSASSPARKAGEITATEFLPFTAGGYLGMKPLPKVSIPGVKVKFYETNKPVSVPGMGVFYENSIKTKIILQGKQTIDRPPTLKEIPIKGEKGIGERKLPASRQTPETKNWISKFEDKLSTGDIVATKKQFYDLKKYQIDMGISVEKVTGKPYEYVRGIDLMKAIEKSKLPRIEKIESIMKETKGGTVGLWETRAEAAAKRPPVKLMSAEERTGIINNIKKFGGLYPKPAIKNIVTAASILGIKAITGQAQKSKIEPAPDVRQTQVVATKQYAKTVTELATISKQRTDLTPASFLSQVSKSVAAQKQISREATKPKIKEQIKAPNKYPEKRILVPQLKPKAFLSKVSQHERMRGKKKIVWDIKNPVPDLKSLGF